MRTPSLSLLFCLTLLLSSYNLFSQDPAKLWLQYYPLEEGLKEEFLTYSSSVFLAGENSTYDVIAEEFRLGLTGMLNSEPEFSQQLAESGQIVVALREDLPSSLTDGLVDWEQVGEEGYVLKTLGNNRLLVTATDPNGLLYGTFALLHQMQLGESPDNILKYDSPRVNLRLLNHWDNLDRTVERGYAGFSIWNWHLLPDYLDPRYKEYARANASIGINGTVLTNVNANALILTEPYLEKVKALAGVFRPYGIKIYLTARFSAPIEIGGLETADPLNADVQQWWDGKVEEIYRHIPDFGGFLVKANSEGQPGPQNYGRTHADGANMLARSLAPHDGIVMWRAFVYSDENPQDRAMQAYDQFMPIDDAFAENVIVQVKNGPIDFQPREPFHPMFGAMEKTPLMMEFQITQEYLGFSSHLVYLPKMFEEVLQEDTYQFGENSTVARIITGEATGQRLTGMAGVSNIGNEENWTGHPIAQANWYGYGRLAWDPELSSEEIAGEWLGLTFTTDKQFVEPMTSLLIRSRESVVKYMTPLGLHHIMGAGHHYGPGPWVDFLGRPEWNSVYYHQADQNGIGFDRTVTGSNALKQYAPEVVEKFADPATCPKEYLLWFHHLPWDFQLNNGHTLWQEMGLTYQEGVDEVSEMINTWERMEEYVDEPFFLHVRSLLTIQHNESIWWKDACMSYFQDINGLDYPEGMETPEKPLSYYKSLIFPYAPGIQPSWR